MAILESDKQQTTTGVTATRYQRKPRSGFMRDFNPMMLSLVVVLGWVAGN
jgi:hypothetical protein